MSLNEKIFREYDIRGVADVDLQDAEMHPLSRAIGTFLAAKGAKTVTLGRDCRLSSDRLHDIFEEGLRSTGLNVIDVGLVPTPLLYYSVFHLKVDGGLMITGSHNPPDQNGFKIMSGLSTIHGRDIQEVLRICKSKDFRSGKGTLKTTDVRLAYMDEICKNFPKPLNIRIAVDNGSGMAGGIAGPLYRRLGCEVTDLFPQPDGAFPYHHPDPTVPDNLSELRKTVAKSGAVAGIAFDGDADRIGVIDRTGRMIYGDELLVIYSRAVLKKHPGAKIISEVKASYRLFLDIAEHGGIPILWKTGHSLIKAKMKEEKSPLAGEMSGHMFFNDRYYGYDDAIYAGVRLLEILSEEGKTPAELLSDLPQTIVTPEIRVDCPDEIKFAVVEESRKALERKGLRVNGIDGARVEYDDGWGLVRASNTQPVLVFRFEATSQKRLDEIRAEIESVVTQKTRELR